jgi:hypothetical protein
MTAFTGNDAAAATRSAEAQELIDRAQSEDVLLTVLSAWDLCALGGPRQVLFDEAPAKAWAGMRRGARKKVPAVIFDGLEERGLLIRHLPAVPLAAPGGQPEARPEEYAFSPKLGLAMAARARPSLAIVCELEQLPTRHPRLFGLGDEQDPIRAVVLETPEGSPPGDFPHLRKAGPLAWFYRYDLVAKSRAASFLAGWALLRSQARPNSARLVTVLRHDQGQLLAVQTLAVRSNDGQTARLGGTGSAHGPEYNQAGLTQIMSGLFSSGRP